MEEWWGAMDIFMKTVWCTAIFTSLVFIIQSVMTFAGMDSDGAMEMDPDGLSDTSGPFQLFTFRNFINFFLGTSWAVIVFRNTFESPALWLGLSVAVGLLLVVAVMMIFRFLGRMEQTGNIDISNAPGCRGTVYLKIPGEKKGEGKVQITIQGAVREYNAITMGEQLDTGVPVVVKEVFNGNTLLVEKF